MSALTSQVMVRLAARRMMATKESEVVMKHVWILPAVASVAFFSFTVSVMLAEGPFGFVTEHTRNGWGNQIGIDLFTSATLALCFAAPLARRHGVRLWPWILLTIATGSIGLLVLQARILYARYHVRNLN